jgi:hypothetical protein
MLPGLSQYISAQTGGLGMTVLFILYQLYAPKYLDHDTALAPIVRDVPEKVDDLHDEQKDIRADMSDVQGTVEEVKDRQKYTMQVQRAQARANDQMDHDRVDSYLYKNGVEPDEFLFGDEMTGYSNWEDDDRDTTTDAQ